MKFGTARICDDFDGVHLKTPYDEEYLDEFRDTIPPEEREWLRDEYRWWVSEKYSKKAIRIASGYFNLEYCDD